MKLFTFRRERDSGQRGTFFAWFPVKAWEHASGAWVIIWLERYTGILWQDRGPFLPPEILEKERIEKEPDVSGDPGPL